MRRNNCWLAVLAVSTVLPILRHGLARERFPLDQEDTELKANRSKAAYGLDQTTPSVGTEEIDVASRNDATKLVLDASPLDQPPKKCTTIDDATKASQRNSEGGCIEDADPSARIHSVDQAIVQLDSKLASGFSLEDSRKRLAGAQTISEWTMLAGNSENSGERRLSTRISRGAVEHTSERTRAVIRADGTVRAATTSGRKRGTVDEETNRRGTRYGDRGASHYSHVGGSSRDDDSLTTPGERNFAGNRPLSGSESTDGRGRRGDGGSPGDGMTGYRSEIGDGEEFSMGGDGEVLSERGYGDRRRYEDFPSGTSEFDLEDRESEGLGERREVGGVRVWSLEEKSRKDRSVYDLMDGGVRSRDLGYDKKRGVKRSAVRKRESEVLHFWEESRNHSVDGKGSFEEMKGQEVEKGSVEFSSDYRENKVKSEAFNFLSTSVLPNSSSEEGSRLGESKFEEQEVDKGSVELKDYREKVKSEAFNFLSTSVLPNSSSEEGSRLGESKFEEQEVDKGSVELKDYREKVKSEAFNFLSTSVLPSLEGGNEVMESKLDHEEQKLSRNSIDLNSSNGDYEKNQIKFATLNYLSTSTPPSSSLEGANKLVESKLDQQEEKLSEKSIDLNSSNEDYQQNQIQSETLNYLSTSIPPGSSLEGADKLVESKLDHQEQKLPKKSIDLNSSNGNYQQNPIKFETLNFLSTLTTPNSNLEGGNKLLKSKFDHQEQKLSKSSIDLNSSNDIYQKNQMKSETLNFQSTLMTPSSSLEGSNKLVESKLDNQEQKLSEKSIDLNSANGNYQKNQIKFETLNFLSTLTTPNSNLEGANKLEESKLDHQEQKLSEKSIDLSSSNDNYQQNQMKSETLNVQSTFMPPSSSLEGAHILAKSKLDHQKQKLPKNSIDPNSSNNNQPQNQIKSEKLNFLSTSAPSLTPAKLADLTPNKLSKRSLDPTSDRLKTPPKPELSPVRFDPSPDRIHPLASSSQESSRERYNSAGIENPERVPTSRKSAEVYKDGSLELRDVSPEQRSTTNNDVPEDNEPASSNRVAFPVSRTAIDVSAVERERGNLHTTNKDEVTLAEEPGKLTNGNGYSYLGENRSVDVVNNGTTHFHFSGDSDANDMSKMENVGSREDRGSPRVEIRDGKEDWRKDVSNDGADFNFPEINVAGNLSERDNLRLNTRSDDNRGVVEEGSRYSVDQDGGKVWKGGKVTLMERSREEMSNSGADFNFPEINVAGNLSERDNLRLNTRSDDNRGVVEEGSRYSVDQDGGKVWKEGKVTLMERSKENVSNSGADFNFSEINAGKLSKMDNLTLIEDKVTLMEESTKLANANGNSPEKPLSSMHHSPRGIGTFDRKNSVSAENPAEGSETPSPMDPVAINSKENQRSPNKNNHSSVNSLNSTHHSFPITGTFDRKISNPSGEDPEDSNSRKNHESPNKNNNSSVNILNSTHSSFPITGTFDRKASDRTNPIISAQKPLKDLNSKEDQRSPNKNNDSSVNILNSTHSSFSITGISDRKTNNPSISAENPEDSNSKEDQRSPNKTNNSSVNILNFTHHSFPIIGTSDRKTSDRKNPSINAQKPPEDSNSKENHQSPNKPNNSSVNPLNSMHPTVPTTDTSTTKSKNSTISSQTPITTQDLLEDSKAPDDSLVVKSRGSQRSSIESHGLWIPSTPFNLGENDDGIEAPEPEAGVADQTLSATGQRSISLTGTSGAVVENHEERGTTSRVSLKLNGPVANDPVIVVKDAASSRDSSNQNSQLSAHGIKDNEPAVGFTSGERVRDVAGNGRGAETIDEVNLDGSWNGDHAGISKSFVESMEQRDSRGNLGNSGAKLGSSMGKLGNSRLGNSFVIGAGNVEKERAEESSWSSLKTGLSGVTGILGNKAKGDTRDPMEGSIGSIEEFLSTKEDETVGGVRVKGFQFSEQEDKMTEGVAVVKDGIKNSMNGETKSSGNSKEMRVENLQSAKLEDQRTQVDLTAVVKDSLKDPMNRKSKSSKEMRVENTESVKQEVQRVEVDLDALLEDSIRDPMDTESESFKSSKKMRAGNLQSVKQEDQMAEVDLTAVVKDSFKDPMNRKSKSSKEMMVENLQSAKQKDQRTQVGLAEIVEDSNHEPINRESKSSKSSKEMRVENPRSVKQEVQRVEVDLDALLEDSIKDPMDTESKSSKSLKKMRVENLQSAKQEDQRTQVGLAEIVEDSNHEPINRESKSSKSSKKMRVENLQSAKQEDQRTQVDLTAVVEDSLKDPMDTESKSSRSSKKMRVEILQSAKQEDQRTQISPTEIVEDREFKSSIEESLDLKKNGTLVKPRAKDLTKQPINTTLHLSSALNKTLNNLMNQSTSSTNDLPSPKGNTSLTSKVSQHKFETQPNPPSTKPNNIDNPQIQSSVLPNNLHSPEQRPSDSPTKQRRDSSGFPTKSEVPSSVLGDKAPNVTSTKIESSPFENLGPGSSVLDRREFIAQSRATITSTMDETTSPRTASFGEDVPFETTESGRMDAGASIASTTDMDRLVYLGTGEDRITTAANVSQGGGDNSSHELEYQWPVKHSAVVEGDLVLGGLMMVHEREDRMTCGPVMPQGGVQAVEAMLYTLDWLNEQDIVPGVKIGAHILDDCDKDTYGLEMAVDFIKGSISNIDGAEYHCNKTAVRKVISGVVGAASSVTSIQVANLLRLFRIPQVSFFSTSPELSNKQRFEYFTRTIPSDHYQVKAMVDIVLRMGWSYVSIIYEESNYGIKAFEELEELLGKYDICIAIKEKLVKDSGVAGETAYDNIVLKLLTKPRAKGCIIYASDQEVAELMRAVRRCNATGAFSWIGSDGWSARGLVSNGNEPEVEGTLSVQPQANPIKGFKEYFLNLTVENNRRNPWFVEFWEDHFQCRYPNASLTPYNKRYTKPCTTKERLTAQNTAVEDQLQFVSDAVMAFAYAFRDIHKRLCREHPKNCGHMNPTNGTELLQYLREVEFEGLSGDKFKFDKNGDGPARYNIIHFKQTEPGKYKWVRVGKYLEGELRLNMSEIQFKLGHPQPPDSVCALPCEVGQAKKYVEGERCCWHCFNCTQYQIRHPKDETQCIQCRQGTVPDETHSTCRDIPQEFLRPESGWAIGAMSFSATGMLITSFVCGVFLKHNDTPVVRASGRELSYVLLSGILLCYLVTFALVMKPTDIVCGIQRFAAGFCFTVVYAALLTKTNRISRIFNASKHSAKRPSFISPRSQLIICSGLVSVQILINGVWMIIDPAKAMHHYPTREDNLLVCNSYVDASYMIAFAYPIMLIVVCTVYAVLTRKIPEAFNESKHIGFTMYTTCVIWLAFVPLYFGTGNNVALRITSMSVTISLSASVTIACLFSPKLYIILIRPERNVRQSMMPARYNTTKSSAVTPTNASSMIAPVTLTAATCDQNKTVKKHIINTIDCSTQSEYYELEVKDQKNGKPPATVVSRSTQTCTNNDKDSSAAVTGKDSKENSTTTTKENTTTKQINNNARIGNGPVNQTDVTL